MGDRLQGLALQDCISLIVALLIRLLGLTMRAHLSVRLMECSFSFHELQKNTLSATYFFTSLASFSNSLRCPPISITLIPDFNIVAKLSQFTSVRDEQTKTQIAYNSVGKILSNAFHCFEIFLEHVLPHNHLRIAS